VATQLDQLAVMTYDTAAYSPRLYAWLVAQQAIRVPRATARTNPACRVLIGLPTYGRAGLSHWSWCENIRLGLRGVRDAYATVGPPENFAGVGIFAHYTTQPSEWDDYERLWRLPPRR
jgi:hypothetical protein